MLSAGPPNLKPSGHKLVAIKPWIEKKKWLAGPWPPASNKATYVPTIFKFQVLSSSSKFEHIYHSYIIKLYQVHHLGIMAMPTFQPSLIYMDFRSVSCHRDTGGFGDFLGESSLATGKMSGQVTLVYIILSQYMNIYLSIYLSVCLSIYLSICMSVCLSIYLSVCLSIHLSVCLSVYLSIYLSVCLSIYLSICLSVCLSICLSVCLSLYLSVCLSICLSIYLSVCLSIYLSVCLSIYLSVCLSIYLSVYLSI